MKSNFKQIKDRREDFLFYFKKNFEKYFDLTKIDLNAPANPNIILDENENQSGFKCETCSKGELICKTSKTGTLYLGCTSFPECRNVFFFSPKIKQYQEIEESCNICTNKMVNNGYLMIN
jgi:ssDNA-binding Zn-finger/Zn-ribbon topoisomerase 1